MSDAFVVTAEHPPAPLRMVGEEITVLASGEQTGSYEIFRQTGAEGSGPPPHNHPWDEAFYITAGRVSFGIGDGRELVGRPGTLVHIPRGTTHWFRFASGGGEMISITSRTAAAAFFTQVDAEISPTEPDFGLLVGIATAHGLDVPARPTERRGNPPCPASPRSTT